MTQNRLDVWTQTESKFLATASTLRGNRAKFTAEPLAKLKFILGKVVPATIGALRLSGLYLLTQFDAHICRFPKSE